MKYWIGEKTIDTKEYICGYCGKNIASEKGFYTCDGFGYTTFNGLGLVYICHNCGNPTYFGPDAEQVPGFSYGKSFDINIFPDKNTAFLYSEIQDCMKSSCFTSAVLSARKLLMHIGVDCGAEKNLSFVEYVNFLDANGYISQNCKKWIDIIRKKGNEANHEIVLFDRKDAEVIVKFVEIIITVVYEMPFEANEYIGD